jgi:hypothetical protein
MIEEQLTGQKQVAGVFADAVQMVGIAVDGLKGGRTLAAQELDRLAVEAAAASEGR